MRRASVGPAAAGPARRDWPPASAAPARRRGSAGADSAAAPAAAEEAVERRVERLLHHDLVLVRDDDPLQLGDAAAGGAQVERPDVEQRLLDRDHEQRALDHLAIPAGSTA